jgi:hypothetical protein
MGVREPGISRETPRACALPTVEEVAFACAVHDMVTAADYRPLAYDEDGADINPQPAPTYTVTELSCRFTTHVPNRAECRFTLSRPNGASVPEPVRVSLEHRFWQDHGPAHHVYGTHWSPTQRCAPAAL